MFRMLPLPPISQFNKALGSILNMGHYTTALSLIQNKLQQFQGIQVNFYTFYIAINSSSDAFIHLINYRKILISCHAGTEKESKLSECSPLYVVHQFFIALKQGLVVIKIGVDLSLQVSMTHSLKACNLERELLPPTSSVAIQNLSTLHSSFPLASYSSAQQSH
ncbi:hypothetical protein HYC85_011601 [Camellia sinensis]|uniref:Uncharacterized protein n=1 Tax=Camellia sinensis TaxID=4442 RepID=A0A7J7HCM6_CAMSI|nr:hypothetical protein HYC85_011601 [Camellia sinensis]